MIARPDEHNRHRALLIRRAELATQVVTKVPDPVRNACILEGIAVRCVEPLELLRRQQHDALDVVQRHRVEIISYGDHERPVHGNREGNPEDEAGALARTGSNLDAAAELLDLAVNNVHPDATPGNLGHGFGGGEAGSQHELRDFLVRQRGPFRHQAALDGLGTHRFHVDAGAVITDLDHHVSAFAGESQVDAASGRLAEVGT